MTHDIYPLYQRMEKQKITFAFKGAVSQDILVELGDILKNKLVIDRKVKKVFSVFIEMTQNVLHYSAERQQVKETGTEIGIGIIVVSETDDCYLVSSGNLVGLDQAESLLRQCEHINSLDADGLKRLYTERRKSLPREGSKGAGLGLIDISRKSDRPLEYLIAPVDERHKFFILTVTVTKGE